MSKSPPQIDILSGHWYAIDLVVIGHRQRIIGPF